MRRAFKGEIYPCIDTLRGTRTFPLLDKIVLEIKLYLASFLSFLNKHTPQILYKLIKVIF